MSYDIVINNGEIFDGLGNKPFMGSIGIKDGKIIKISNIDLYGKKIIDAEKLAVSPGFIDVHTHTETNFLKDLIMESRISQGITTDIIGNCGISMFPRPEDEAKINDFNNYCSELLLGILEVKEKFSNVEDYIKHLEDIKISLNCGILVGHGALRICAMGFDNREASDKELEYMKNLLEHQLKNGALGMSLGLIYPPGSYSNEKELVELGKIIKKYDAVITSHMRNEGEKVFEAVSEMIRLAEKSGAHVHISHLKLMGPSKWKKAKELVKLIDDAKNRGINISVDQYPYRATSTTLSAVVPDWVQSGGNSKMVERLKNPTKEILDGIADLVEKRGGAEAISIAYTHGNLPEVEGKNIKELSEEYKIGIENTIAKILYDSKGKVNAVYYSMVDEDVDYIMSRQDILIASDSFAFELRDRGKGMPHPRTFGTFPRFIRLNREKKLLTLEKAIRKITSLPAKTFGLKNIGSIEEGNFADIVIFDKENITDKSEFSNPFQRAEGIKHLIISGKMAIENEKILNSNDGRVIKR